VPIFNFVYDKQRQTFRVSTRRYVEVVCKYGTNIRFLGSVELGYVKNSYSTVRI
jgi:hypothetical protein